MAIAVIWILIGKLFYLDFSFCKDFDYFVKNINQIIQKILIKLLILILLIND